MQIFIISLKILLSTRFLLSGNLKLRKPVKNRFAAPRIGDCGICLPELYLKIHDYPGASRYFNWFHKNFPEDSGYPLFLFEWAITLFKTGKIKSAEDQILKTYSSNAYVIHAFLEIENNDLSISENSNWETSAVAYNLPYSKNDPELLDFADWLSDFIKEGRFDNGAL